MSFSVTPSTPARLHARSNMLAMPPAVRGWPCRVWITNTLRTFPSARAPASTALASSPSGTVTFRSAGSLA